MFWDVVDGFKHVLFYVTWVIMAGIFVSMMLFYRTDKG